MKKESINLSVKTRAATDNLSTMRLAGNVPGVVYGPSMKNTMICCAGKELQNVYTQAGESTLVHVDVDGKTIPCLIHAISFDPVSSKIEHIDLYAVDMTKKVTARVPVYFTGVSPAVKTQGGILMTIHSNVEVTCLPADLPHGFTVDISALQNFRDIITVAAIQVPAGVTIKTPLDTAIVTVQEPRKEEVVETVAAAPVAGAEGAAAPAAGAAPAATAPTAPAGEKADDKKAAKK